MLGGDPTYRHKGQKFRLRLGREGAQGKSMRRMFEIQSLIDVLPVVPSLWTWGTHLETHCRSLERFMKNGGSTWYPELVQHLEHILREFVDDDIIRNSPTNSESQKSAVFEGCSKLMQAQGAGTT